jgi:hypothetical protein
VVGSEHRPQNTEGILDQPGTLGRGRGDQVGEQARRDGDNDETAGGEGASAVEKIGHEQERRAFASRRQPETGSGGKEALTHKEEATGDEQGTDEHVGLVMSEAVLRVTEPTDCA